MLQFLQDNLELIIALSAFLLSLCQLIDTKIKRRVNLYIQIDNAQLFIRDQNVNNLLLLMTIVNKSDAPLNITQIYFIDGKTEYLCYLKKQWSGEHYYPVFPETDIPRTERIFSANFPLALQPNDAKSELIRFSITSNISIKKEDIIKLKIVTSKRTIVREIECRDDRQDLIHI